MSIVNSREIARGKKISIYQILFLCEPTSFGCRTTTHTSHGVGPRIHNFSYFLCKQNVGKWLNTICKISVSTDDKVLRIRSNFVVLGKENKLATDCEWNERRCGALCPIFNEYKLAEWIACLPKIYFEPLMKRMFTEFHFDSLRAFGFIVNGAVAPGRQCPVNGQCKSFGSHSQINHFQMQFCVN